jgi:hypothetical protein
MHDIRGELSYVPEDLELDAEDPGRVAGLDDVVRVHPPHRYTVETVVTGAGLTTM